MIRQRVSFGEVSVKTRSDHSTLHGILAQLALLVFRIDESYDRTNKKDERDYGAESNSQTALAFCDAEVMPEDETWAWGSANLDKGSTE